MMDIQSKIEAMESDLAEMTRRRDEWRKKAEGYDAVRKALREKVGALWPPNLSRALWAGIAADEKKRADEAEERIETLEAERDAALAQVAAAFEAAAQVVVEAGVAGDHPDDPLACMIRDTTPAGARAAYDAALRKARAEGMREAADVIPRADSDESRAGWTLDMDALKELRADAGDWGYSIDLEAVEGIALSIIRRIRALASTGGGE